MKIPFTITEHDGIARARWPVCGGLPLPRGMTSDPARLTVHDETGAALPLQTEAMARWPDGSVRWVLLDFQADLEAQATRAFTLEIGDPPPPAPLLEPWGVTDGEPLPRAVEAMRGSHIRLVDPCGPTWQPEPGATTIERRGALHAVVCTRGLLRSPAGDRRLYWEAYTDFHRDTRWTHTRFFYWADAQAVSFIPRPKTAPIPLEFSEFSIVVDLALGEGLLRCCCSRSQWQSARHGPYEAGHALAQVQEDEQAWRITDREGQTLESGRDKSEGYAGSRRDGREGVGLALTEIWQSHPKALHAGAETLEAALWPRESGAPLRVLPGAGRAHSLVLTPYRDPAELRRLTLGLTGPILPRARIEEFNRSGVMPALLSPHETPVPLLERLTEAMFPGFLSFSNVETMGVWGSGEWNWGDFRAPLYEQRRIPIGHGAGGIWGNGEAQVGYGMLLQYLRTGRLDCLTMGLACARHKAGVDTVHDAQGDWQIGAQHIHSLEHATGQCVACHTWTSELALGWLMTGDVWLRSVLAQTCRHLILIHEKTLPTDFRERAGGWLLIALCACYEGLGEPRCLEVGRRVAEGLKHWIEEENGAIWIPPARQAHAPSHVFIALTGLADFWRLTGDPLAKEALLAGGRLVLERGRDASGFFMTADAPGYRIYSQVPRWPLAQSLSALDALYRLTGDVGWLEVGVHQCRLLFKLLQAETGWREEAAWPHAGGLHYAYAFGFLESARQQELLRDV